MPSGGSRAFSGPAPDPMALRRDRPNDQATWTDLALDGRPGPPPPWPLPPVAVADRADESVQRELDVWAGLWSKPQAVQWERLGLQHEVAIYARRAVEVEAPGASVSLGTLVRQLGEALGLTPAGMLRLRWRLAAAPTRASAGESTRSRAPRRASPRARLTVVDRPDDDDPEQ